MTDAEAEILRQLARAHRLRRLAEWFAFWAVASAYWGIERPTPAPYAEF